MNNTETYIIVIKSYNYAVLLYKILKNKKYNAQIISTPCRISAGCSRSIRFYGKDIDIVKDEIKKNSIPIKGIYLEKKVNKKNNYIKIED